MNFCPECGIECDGLPIAYSNGELILLGNHNVDGVECLKRQVIQKAYQLAAKSAECEKLKELLKKIEFSGDIADWVCPCCQHYEQKHYKGCELAALLNEKGE